MSPLSIARATRHVVIVPLLLAALAGSAPPRTSHAAPARATVRTFTISAAHPSFPKSIPAGLLALHVIGNDKDDFAAGVSRLNPGASIAQVETASATFASLQGFVRLTHLVTFLGGTAVPAGGAATVVIDMRTPGQYGLHILRGDQGPGQNLLFTVTPADTQGVTPPRADAAVMLAGTRIGGIPSILPAGATTFKVTNRGPWVHAMLLFRLDPGKTVRDVVAAIKGNLATPWMHDAGDMNLLSPHQAAWLTDTLLSGTYVAYCFLPNPSRGGEPFVLEGMIASFSVS